MLGIVDCPQTSGTFRSCFVVFFLNLISHYLSIWRIILPRCFRPPFCLFFCSIFFRAWSISARPRLPVLLPQLLLAEKNSRSAVHEIKKRNCKKREKSYETRPPSWTSLVWGSRRFISFSFEIRFLNLAFSPLGTLSHVAKLFFFHFISFL